MTRSRLVVAVLVFCSLAMAIAVGVQVGARHAAVAANDAPVTTHPHRAFAEEPRSESLLVTADIPIVSDPLPPVDTPLADVFDDLAARASRGDHRAACRLALEIQTCQTDHEWLSLTGRAVSAYDDADTDAMSAAELASMEGFMETIQRNLDQADAIAAHCAGVPRVSRAREVGWWRQAALGGNAFATHHYVTGSVFPPTDWMRNPEAMVQMRRDLEPLAWREVEAGDVDMAWLLMEAYQPRSAMERAAPLMQAVETDAETALALALYIRDALGRVSTSEWEAGMYSEAVDSRIPELRAVLGANQVAQAEAQSQAWISEITLQPIFGATGARYSRSRDRRHGWPDRHLESCAGD